MGSRWFPLGVFEDEDPDSVGADNDASGDGANQTGSGLDEVSEVVGDNEWDIALTRQSRKKARRAVKREERIQRKLEKKLVLEESKPKEKDEFIDFSLPPVALHAPTDEEIDIIFQVHDSERLKTEPRNIYKSTKSVSDSRANAWEKDIREVWLHQGVDKPFVDERKRTENNALTFASSGDARLDFFFQVMEKTGGNITEELVRLSWEQNPLDTLKLISYLRNCRQGKGVRYPYQVCLHWLYKNHPRTVYENMAHLVSFGYWKDLLHFLMTICFEGTIPHYLLLDDSPHMKGEARWRSKSLKEKYENVKNREETSTRKGKPRNPNTRRKDREVLLDLYWQKKGTLVYNKKVIEMYTKYIDPQFKLNMAIQHLPKKVMRDAALKVARHRLETDSKYTLFFTKIAQLFAQQVLTDQEHMENGNKKAVSLCGKWSPDLKGHFDRYTLIGTGIALELIKLRNQTFQMEKPFESVRCYLARKVYHKEYLVGLKKYLQLPEVAMSARDWKTVNYKRVPALSMLRNMKIFINHDKDRFEKFVKNVKKIPGMTLKPHQIIGKILHCLYEGEDETTDTEIGDIIMEKQWKSLVENIKSGDGVLKNALAICDVSGSMKGEPMIAAIALTFLTMELSESPWNEFCIPFHDEPSVFMVDQNDSLKSKVTKMLGMPVGFNTDFNKVFELILAFANEIKAKTGEVKSTLPKTLLVFTDMEFDEAFQGADETNFEFIKKRFDEEGFVMPNIVFWNLRGDSGQRSVPVRKDEEGTLLMSGFSGQQLRLVLKNQELDKEELTPLEVMLRAIKSPPYDVFKVYD